jgi:hypothetical protein
MIFFPILESSWVFADAAMPPPVACKTRLMKSHEQKTMVYVRGLKRERWAPYIFTILARQRYIAALKKAGAIVSVMRYMRKKLFSKGEILSRIRAM